MDKEMTALILAVQAHDGVSIRRLLDRVSEAWSRRLDCEVFREADVGPRRDALYEFDPDTYMNKVRRFRSVGVVIDVDDVFSDFDPNRLVRGRQLILPVTYERVRCPVANAGVLAASLLLGLVTVVNERKPAFCTVPYLYVRREAFDISMFAYLTAFFGETQGNAAST